MIPGMDCHRNLQQVSQYSSDSVILRGFQIQRREYGSGIHDPGSEILRGFSILAISLVGISGSQVKKKKGKFVNSEVDQFNIVKIQYVSRVMYCKSIKKIFQSTSFSLTRITEFSFFLLFSRDHEIPGKLRSSTVSW